MGGFLPLSRIPIFFIHFICDVSVLPNHLSCHMGFVKFILWMSKKFYNHIENRIFSKWACRHVPWKVWLEHSVYINAKKVKALFRIHIQAQSAALQTLTSTFPGHWPSPVGIYPSGYLSRLPGAYTATHKQLCITAYKSALTGTHLLLGQEK